MLTAPGSILWPVIFLSEFFHLLPLKGVFGKRETILITSGLGFITKKDLGVVF